MEDRLGLIVGKAIKKGDRKWVVEECLKLREYNVLEIFFLREKGLDLRRDWLIVRNVMIV